MGSIPKVILGHLGDPLHSPFFCTYGTILTIPDEFLWHFTGSIPKMTEGDLWDQSHRWSEDPYGIEPIAHFKKMLQWDWSPISLEGKHGTGPIALLGPYSNFKTTFLGGHHPYMNILSVRLSVSQSHLCMKVVCFCAPPPCAFLCPFPPHAFLCPPPSCAFLYTPLFVSFFLTPLSLSKPRWS